MGFLFSFKGFFQPFAGFEFEAYQAKISVEQNLTSPYLIQPLVTFEIGLGLCVVLFIVLARR